MARPAPLIASAVMTAALLAGGLGHDLCPWESDSGRSRFAFCCSCGLAAAVTLDREEPEQIFGSCVTIPCPGVPAAPAWSTAHAEAA